LVSTPAKTKPGLGGWVRRTVFGTLLIIVVVLGGTAFRVWQDARSDVRTPADVIVVLGAAQYNGTPSKIFEARLAKAKTLYEEGVAKTIITSGGKKSKDNYTEAAAGAQWLRRAGVPAADTIAVGTGNDTLRSLRAVADEVHKRGWRTAVLVSDPWHSLRATIMAEDAGLEAWPSPVHRGPIVQTRETQFRYIFRETGALLFYQLTKTPADDFGGTDVG
jgi:uncharacterized SAM-binding protein YcdF (DUF218 family)